MKKEIQKYGINTLDGTQYAVQLSPAEQKQDLKDKVIPLEPTQDLKEFILSAQEFNVQWLNKKSKETGYQTIMCLSQDDMDKILAIMNTKFKDSYSYTIVEKVELPVTPVKKVRKTRTTKPQDWLRRILTR